MSFQRESGRLSLAMGSWGSSEAPPSGDETANRFLVLEWLNAMEAPPRLSPANCRLRLRATQRDATGEW